MAGYHRDTAPSQSIYCLRQSTFRQLALGDEQYKLPTLPQSEDGWDGFIGAGIR